MPLFNRLLALAGCLWLALTASASTFDEEVRQRLAELPLQDVEGLWQFPVSETVIAVERDNPEASRFRIFVVSSPYLVLSPNLTLGYAYPTAKRNVFDARLKEITAEGAAKSSGEKRFTITLNESDALTFVPVKKGLSLSWDWRRLFPYFLRFRINNVDNREKGLDGAIRLWPRSASKPPRQPRYL